MMITGAGGICVATNTIDRSIPSVNVKEINKSDVHNNSSSSTFKKSENVTRPSPWNFPELLK